MLSGPRDRSLGLFGWDVWRWQRRTSGDERLQDPSSDHLLRRSRLALALNKNVIAVAKL